MLFAYEAMRHDGTTVLDRVEAGDRAGAAAFLRDKGLLILRLEEHAGATGAPRGGLGQRASGRAAGAPRRAGRAALTLRDRILFTRQMKMLLEAGTPLVPALAAVQQQTSRPAVQATVRRLRERVEEGDSLTEALEAEGALFDPVFRTMIAAGEATASLPRAFDRLCTLTGKQHQARKLVLGALLYPAILSVMLTGVVSILLFFVVPRFALLFSSLHCPLPATTHLLFGVAEALRNHWPYVLGGLLTVVVGIVLGVRLPATRQWLDRVCLRLPLIGPVMSRLIFARVVRVWAAMLGCHVPLLEALRRSRAAIRNHDYLQLLTQVEETVAGGGRMGPALAAARLADPVIVSAITTGENNGRLADAAEFVSAWMDDDNASLVQHITRLTEPVLLAVMGVVVGFVALSLFVPLFDLATAAH